MAYKGPPLRFAYDALEPHIDAETMQLQHDIDEIAERIQLLPGVSIAMAADVAQISRVPRPPRGQEEAPLQLSRLLEAHEIEIREIPQAATAAAHHGDDGTNDLRVSSILRTNELRAWFLAEHLVDVPCRSG